MKVKYLWRPVGHCIAVTQIIITIIGRATNLNFSLQKINVVFLQNRNIIFDDTGTVLLRWVVLTHTVHCSTWVPYCVPS